MRKSYLILLFTFIMTLFCCHNLACGHTNLADMQLGKIEHSSSLLNKRIMEVDACPRHSNMQSRCISKQILKLSYTAFVDANQNLLISFNDSSDFINKTQDTSYNYKRLNSSFPRAP